MAKQKRDPEVALLSKLAGTWSGSSTTWFQPGSPALEGKISGKIAKVLSSNAIAHTYRTRLEGKPVQGIATIGKDIATLKVGICWVDTFHTGGDVMLLQRDGTTIKNGFSVSGQYATGPDTPPWSWRTTYELKNANRLEIIHYNVLPDGTEAMAVRIDYRRGKA